MPSTPTADSRLDPQIHAMLDQLGLGELPDLSGVEPATMRELFSAMPGIDAVGPAIAKVEERELPGPAGPLRVRCYTPHGTGPFPLLVYFHGGGFVLCSLETHDSTCRLLANGAGCVVVSVDYRLAPEAKFPAAAEDCYAATRWAADHAVSLGARPGRLAVAGDSAGGNLAAVVAQLARDRGGPALLHQLLIYPVTDCRFDTESYVKNASGYLLTRDMMMWFWNHYLESPAQAADPLASPLRAADLAGLAPATVLTAEFDPLRDEGEAYARRLTDAGVPTRLRRFDGMIHGFFAMTEIVDCAGEAVAYASSELSRAFAAGG